MGQLEITDVHDYRADVNGSSNSKSPKFSWSLPRLFDRRREPRNLSNIDLPFGSMSSAAFVSAIGGMHYSSLLDIYKFSSYYVVVGTPYTFLYGFSFRAAHSLSL